MTRDFRRWLKEIEALGLLRTVREAHWEHELGAVADLNSKHRKYTLLFDEIQDYPKGFRVVTAPLIDSKRLAVTLEQPIDISDVDLVRFFRKQLASGGDAMGGRPAVTVNHSPLFENVMEGEEVDLLRFPTPKWFEGDGGRYLGTGDAVITRDPDSGWVNVGSYRMMLRDSRSLVIFLEGPRHGRFILKKYWDRGEPAPIAVSFGHHPMLQMVAGMEVPSGVSEYDYAGALTGLPYQLVEGPRTKLPLPADSELSIEGHVYPEPSTEGPFGEFMGYYASGSTESPTVKVEALYFRNDPIILGACVGKPPHDTAYFRCPLRAAVIWDILEKAGVEGIEGVWCHETGYSRALTVISLRQMFAGHAQMAGHLACQCRPGVVSGRYVVVVDEDIDPSNLEDVVWAICSRSDPASGIDIVRGSVGTPLDPISDHPPGKDILEYTSSRAIVYAAKPFKKIFHNTFPKVVEPGKALKERVLKEWAEIF